MKLQKTERYEAGYSRSELLKKCAAAAAAAVMFGSMTACGYAGGLETPPEDYAGGMTVGDVSGSDAPLSYDGEEIFMLDGDVVMESSSGR